MIKTKFYIILAALLLGISGCQKVLDINTDPNKPLSAEPEQILPAAEVELATSLGNGYAFLCSMWGQYWTGGPTVSSTPVEFHTLTGTDVNASYSRTYFRSLADLNVIITKSNQPIFSGIAKLLTAYTMQVLVDLHGDVPYSEAFKGEVADGNIITPKFDKDTSVYAKLIPLIDEAIIDLQQTGELVRKPGTTDIIYGGNVNKWIAFANTLKLKILVRQCVANPAKLAEAVTLLSTGSFIDGTNPALVQFSGTSLSYNNPLYARFASRTATGMYYTASQTSVNVLDSLGDPRIAKLYAPGTGGFIGINQGEGNNSPYKGQPLLKYASPGPSYIYNAATPFFLISEWESKFLQAEVLLRSGNPNDSLAIADAITASFNYFGISPSSTSAYIADLDWSNKLKLLATQKWISMNGLQMTEGWIETRRFDVESTNSIIFRGNGGIFFSPTQNSLGFNRFPSIFVYPSSEVQYNPNTPSRQVTDKVFWDN